MPNPTSKRGRTPPKQAAKGIGVSSFEARRWLRTLVWGLKSYPEPTTETIKGTVAMLYLVDEMCRREPRFRRSLQAMLRSWLGTPSRY